MATLYRRVLIPVHGGPSDLPTIKLATALIGRSGHAELTLVYVVEVPQQFPLDADLPDAIERGESVLERCDAYARKHGADIWRPIASTLLQARFGPAAIVDEAIERDADAIILGVTNEERYGETTQGDALPYVLNNAPCDVVALRVARGA